MDPVRVIRAAGGVVWRGSGAAVEVALVHRPRYDDWTLPKGKLERAEPILVAAVREVEEETGITAVPQIRLPSIGYLTGEPGVGKTVDFWSMRMVAQRTRAPDHEVTEVRWVPVADCAALLSYAHDRGVVSAFAELPPVLTELALVRHARAGTRAGWSGPDQERPLDPSGAAQATELARILAVLRPARVVSASPLRCRQTVAPLGLPVQVDPVFDEDAAGGPAAARERITALAARAGVTVVCGQGKVIPGLLAALAPLNATAVESFHTDKGAGWLLCFHPGGTVTADRVPLL